MSDRPRIQMIPDDDSSQGGSSSALGEPGAHDADTETVFTDAPFAEDGEDDSPYGRPRADDSWAMRKYLAWAVVYHRLRSGGFKRWFTSLPEWKQGGSLALLVVMVLGLFWLASTYVELSQPLPDGQLTDVVEPPSEEEVAATAEETLGQAKAAVAGGQYLDALVLIDSLPDSIADKATLKTEATTKMKEESDKVRFESTYEQGLAYMKAKDYPMAVETFQILLDASTGSSMYKDADKQLEKAMASSGKADSSVGDEAVGDLSAVNDEQRERKALRVYNLTFMRDSSAITDAAFRAREALVNVTNGWRDPELGVESVESALGKLREAHAHLSDYSAPSMLDDEHSAFMSAAEALEADLEDALDSLEPYSKAGVKADMALIKADNDDAIALREEVKAILDELDAAARTGTVLTESEIDRDLGGER